MQRYKPAISRLLAAVAGLAFGLMGAELTFGSLRPEGQRDAVLYSIEVRNEAGDLLASPMLVGEEGRPVHLSLVGPHSEPMAMSLDLDPKSAGGDNLCVGYRLSIRRRLRALGAARRRVRTAALGAAARRRRVPPAVAGGGASALAAVRADSPGAAPSDDVIHRGPCPTRR